MSCKTLHRFVQSAALATGLLLLQPSLQAAGIQNPGVAQSAAPVLVAAASSETASQDVVSARQLVPAKLRESGVLRLGGDPGSSPFYLKQSGTKAWAGATYELMAAMADKMGLQLEFTPMAYGSLITALQANRVDVSAGAITDTEARQKIVDFVDYEEVWHTLLVQAGNPHGVHSLDDTCGLTAGAPIGGLDGTIMEKQSERCVAAGKKAIKIKQFQGVAASTQALLAKQVDLIAEEIAGARFLKTTPDGAKVDIVPQKIPDYQGTHGIAVLKGDTQLIKALTQALQETMASSEYETILKKYDL